MSDKTERNYWHPGFIGAMELELRSFRKNLEFKDEHSLSKEPIKMDMLIIKKSRDVVIDNQIGNIFREHNIFEYKSPDAGITIDDYYKTMAYAYLYKALGNTVDEISGAELTVTMVRDVHPDGLFKKIADYGGAVERKFPGIYYIRGVFNTPSQFIVGCELDTDLHAFLKALTKKAEVADVKTLLCEVQGLTEPGDRRNADSVLQLSMSANGDVYDEIRRDPTMIEALRELMKDEIDEELRNATANAANAAAAAANAAADASRVSMIQNLMRAQGLDAGEAMSILGVPDEDRARFEVLL